LWTNVAPVIIKRFSEREDSVRLDVFSTFNDLVRQTGNISKGTGQGAMLDRLRACIPQILKPLCAHLRDKSVKTRQGAVGVVREVAAVIPGCFNEHADVLVPGLLVALGDKPVKNLQLKLEALMLLRLLLTHSTPEGAFTKHLDAFLPLVKDATTDQYFKVVSEALRVCAAMVVTAGPNRVELILRIYDAIQPQMLALDIDQAVKEAAISATALVVATLGTKLKNSADVLKLFNDRLGNEITRAAAVAAVGVMAEARVDLSSVLVDFVRKLSSFLRKANRSLKTSSIHSLAALVRNYGTTTEFTSALHELVIEELSKIINETDLHLSQLALTLGVRILEVSPAAAKSVKDKLYPQVLLLVQSSLLQGQALDALTLLFATLVRSHQAVFTFKDLLDSLMSLSQSNQKLVKQNYLSIGRCVSAIVLNSNANDAQATVQRFITDIKGGGSEQQRLISLYCLGDIGRKSDLSAHGDLRATLSTLLDSDNEEIRAAASYALGSISVGNLSAFLPTILKDVQQSKRQYLLLHSIREIIIDAPPTALAPHLDTIMALLFDNAKSEDDGTRNVVAECLGKLAAVDPKKLIGELEKHLKVCVCFVVFRFLFTFFRF
jgi:cullin-associated NEDD8-dissociated protein 1